MSLCFCVLSPFWEKECFCGQFGLELEEKEGSDGEGLFQVTVKFREEEHKGGGQRRAARTLDGLR